ncbi:NifU family protein [Rothia nasimurium]|uniref:NifU family protein n=1 Tax=Rothia nasimurium TaxID=85336 RepID=A0A4Y9F405_9MICC|nr:NifU family protein [Rothia nasimurium]MBF0808062.1 NifU family protein [Rothia nasimurium]TFU22641.1 NifU family protein [Rothia nasimurium]
MRVLLHPEATDHPAEVRWVLPDYPGDLALVASHPASPLMELVADGTLKSVAGEPGAILTLAHSPEAWKGVAGKVRRAVEDAVAPALADRQGAREETSAGAVSLADQQLLQELAPQVLERYVRPLAGAHGGTIDITRVADDTVWVYLDGACRGCPAAAFTLQQRFERELTRKLPGAQVREDRSRR